MAGDIEPGDKQPGEAPDAGKKDQRDENGKPAAATNTRERTWAIAFAASALVLLVVVVAAWVEHTLSTRDAELQAHYARFAAHAAEEAQKRRESFVALAHTIGGINDGVHEELVAEEQAAEAARQVERLELEQTLASARYTYAQQALQLAKTRHDAAAKKLVAAADKASKAAKQAQDDAKTAKKAADEAQDTSQQLEIQVKSQHARDTEKASLPAATGPGAKGPTQVEFNITDDATKGAGKTPKKNPKIDTALADEVKVALLLADAEAAKERAAPLLAQAARSRQAADEAFKALKKAQAKEKTTTKRLTKVEDTADSAKKDVDKAEQDYDAARLGAHRAALDPLPSHAQWIKKCASELSDDEPVLVACVAQAVLGAAVPGSRSRGIDVEQCPTSKPTPRSQTGPTAYFPVPLAYNPGGKLHICLAVPLGELVSDLASTSADSLEKGFDGILLVDARSGKVLEVESSDPTLRLRKLPDYEPALGESSQESTIKLGPETYRVFLEPVPGRIDLGKAGKVQLVVAGLVMAGRLAREARRLPPMLFLWAVLGLAFIVVCWPVGKLWLVGSHSRFSRFDAAFLGLTAVAALVLATVLVLALTARARLRARLDSQLEHTSDAVSEQLTRSLEASTGALKTFLGGTEKVRAAQAGDFKSFAGRSTAPCMLLRDRQGLWYCEYADQKQLLERQSQRLVRDGAIAFWADANGNERLKWLVGDTGMPPVSVASRRYFKRALAGDQVALLKACPKVLGVPAVIRSITSTELALVVAQQTRDPKTGEPNGVAVVQTSTAPFDRLVLPPGFQFAVIREDGTVMLHSNNRAHHGHNFFEDLDRQGDIRVRMQDGGGYVDADYRGTPSRLWIQRHSSGWFVVAVASKRVVDASVMDSVVTTVSGGMLFLVLLGIVILVGAWVMSFHRRRPAQRARPGTAFEGRRTDLAICFLLAGLDAIAFALLVPLPTTLLFVRFLTTLGALVLALLAIDGAFPAWRVFAPRWVRAVVLAIALAGLETVDEALCLRGWHLSGSPLLLHSLFLGFSIVLVLLVLPHATCLDSNVARRYSACSFCLAVGLIVAPTTLLFAGAHSAAVEGLIGEEGRSYVHGMGSSPNCTLARAKLPDECGKPVLLPVKSQSVCEMKHGTAYPWWLWPARALRRNLPLHVRAAYLASNVPAAQAPARAMTWHVARPGPCVSSATLARGGLVLVPGLVEKQNGWRFAWLAVLFLLMLAGGDLIAYASVRRLFFTKLIDDWRRAPKREREIEQRLRPLPVWTVVVAPSAGFRKFLEKEKRPWNLVQAGSASALDDTRKLKDAKAKVPVVVLADTDPVFDSNAPERAAEWAAVLADFDYVQGQGPGRSGLALRSRKETTPAACEHAWLESNDDERRVLAQIAFDGHASPHPNNAAVLDRLACRGLVNPATLAIDNHKLLAFVRHRVTPEDIRTWDAGETEFAWTVVRVPLTAGVLIVLVLIGYSQPDLAQTGTLLLPSFGAAIPVALRIFSSIAGRKTTATA